MFTSQFPHFKHILGSKKKTKSWEPGEDCPSSKLPLSWKLLAKPLTNTAKVGNIGMLASGRTSLVESHEFESHEPSIRNEKKETHKYIIIYPKCSKYPVRMRLGTKTPLQKHSQKGLEHKG